MTQGDRTRPPRWRGPSWTVRPGAGYACGRRWVTSIPARTSPSARPPIWTRDFSLALGGTLFQASSFYLLLPVLPLLVVGPMGLGEEAVGLVVGIFSLSAVLVRPLGGLAMDRFGRRPWLLGATALLVISNGGYLISGSLGALLATRLLHGLAFGIAGMATATVVADLVPPSRRGTGMGYYGLAMPIALSVGPMLGAMLLEEVHFARVFGLAGLLAAVALGAFALVRVPLIRNPDAKLTLAGLVEPRVFRLFFFMLPVCIGYGGWVAFAPLYAPSVGLESSGPLFFWYAVGTMATRLVGGGLYDRLGPRLPGLVGLALVVVGWLILGVWSSRYGAMVGALLPGVGFGILMPVFHSMTIDLVVPTRRGAATATVFSSFDIGVAAGAMGFGLLVEQGQLHWVFLTSAVLVGGAMAYFAWAVVPHFLRNRLPQDTTPPALER